MQWEKINELLDALLELEPSERSAALTRECAGDEAMRREIESLLSAHENADGFIETPFLEMSPSPNLGPELEKVIGSSISHYHVADSLGAGGMGQVFLARDTKLGRRVALKLLPRQFTKDKNRIRRFQQEACAASALNHPNILTVFEIGQEEDLHFIVTEYVEGETLRQRVKPGGSDLLEVLEAGVQIADALATAHGAGIIHRDVKPDNIMLRPDGLVKVLDFGIAKLSQAARTTTDSNPQSDTSIRTETGVVVGTVQYMSPEQLRGIQVDLRTDVFSLGVVLYELVAGVRPFTGESTTDVIVSILEKEPPPLSAPRELEQILNKALQKDRERRYSTATEFGKDLKALIQKLKTGRHHPVRCPACQSENPAMSAYCSGCGNALRKECPGCGQEVLVTDQFCGACGHRFESIAATNVVGAATVESRPTDVERKHATVIYSLISGCTGILEQLNSEEADAVLASIRSRATELVRHYEGVVERCSAEELVAIFGIPLSNEDDLFRAVHVGLELHSLLRELSDDIERRFGVRLNPCTGISSGAVLTRRDASGTLKATGDALQVASRLAAFADADEILVSSGTQRTIEPFFRLEQKGSVTLWPKSSPATVYRVEGETGAHTRLDAAKVVGLTTYTGREEELGVLQSLFERAAAGEGQLITVLGDAGVGKSRLLLEFQRELHGKTVRILQSRCEPHSAATPYLPFIDLLRHLIEIREDSPERIRQHIIARINAIDPDLSVFLPIYLNLLSIPGGEHSLNSDVKGDDLRVAIQEALLAVLTLQAKSGPAIILLEDWHWSDEASKEALKRLAELVVAQPLMIVVTCRPERSPDWALIGNHTLLNLAPLNQVFATRIAESILGVEELPEGLDALLYNRTGGNPFFIEELCRTLLEDEVVRITDGRARLEGSLEDLNLPDSIQAVIRTRLDRLDGDSQRVITYASVLGREFTLPILQRLCDKSPIPGSLEALLRQGLIQQLRVVPEPAYRFKHVLTQQVAYDSLLMHRRKSLHEEAGRAIEDLYRSRLEEHLEVLTFHYAGAENWAKAVEFGREAAEKAGGLCRYGEALSLLERAEEWLQKAGSRDGAEREMMAVLFAQERLCETLGLRDRQQMLIDRILKLAALTTDQALIAEALVRQGELSTLLGRFDEAESAFDKALVIQRTLSDPIGERVVLRNMGFLHWQQGRYNDAVSRNNTAITIDLDQNDTAGYAKDLTNLASILRSQGKPVEALEYVNKALEVDDIRARPFSYVYTLTVAANVQRDLGEPERAKEHYQRAIELTIQHRLPLHQIIIASALGSLCWERREFDEALGLSNDLVALTRRLHLKRELAQSLAGLSQRLFDLDRFEEALPHLKEAADIFYQLGESEGYLRTLTLVAYVYERCGSRGGDDALRAWDEVRKLVSEANPAAELEALEGMARVARNHQRDSASAVQYLSSALLVAERIGDATKQGELLNSLGIVEFASGNYGSALNRYRTALAVFLSTEDDVHAGLMLNSIGLTLLRLKRLSESAAQLREAIELHRKTGQQLLEGHALATLGDLSDEAGSSTEAQEYYIASLKIRRAIGDRKGEGWMLHHVARVLVSKGEQEEGAVRLREAVAIATETGDQALKEACEQLTKAPFKQRR
jgi:tetratricopeptide (TPR) repeat protein/class 3 adenylate cyclase